MTNQIPDTIVYESQKFFLSGVKGIPLFVPSVYGFKPVVMSTGCYRGFYCEFIFEQDLLFLDKLTIRTVDQLYTELHCVRGKQVPWLPEADDKILEYADLRLPMVFTGGLIIVREQLLPRLPVINPSAFEIVIELSLRDGHLVNEIDHSEKMKHIRVQIEKIEEETREERIQNVKEGVPSQSWRQIRELEWSFAPDFEEQPSW